MSRIILVGVLFLLISCAQTGKSQDTCLFKWDFSKPKTINYKLEQKALVESATKKDTPLKKSEVEGKCDMLMVVGDNQLAIIKLQNLLVTGKEFGEQGTTPIEPMKAPEQVHHNLTPAGTFKDAIFDISFSIMFILSGESMKVGDKDEKELKIPFDFMNNKLNLTGKLKFEFVGFDNLEGKKCAVLKTQINLNKFELPESLKGEFKIDLEAFNTHYFECESGICLRIDMESSMKMLIDKPKSAVTPYSVYMDSKIDGKFKIRIINN